MRRLLDEAVAVRRQLAAEEPAAPDLAFELAFELLHRAHGERTLAPDSQAEAEARRVALAALPPLLSSPPPQATREPMRWADYLVGAAGFLITEGRFGDAELATGLALVAVESRPATGRDRQRESILAALYGSRTQALVALGRPREAIEAASRGIALHRAWLDEPESRPTHVINLFWLLTEAMDLALETGAVDGAGGLIDEAEALAREEGWSGGHGQVALGMLAEKRGDLHAALATRATSAAERGRRREAARAAYGEALRLYEATTGAEDLGVAESLPALRAKLTAMGGVAGSQGG
jgi:tetratricopeptide (TPR) repeat protein